MDHELELAHEAIRIMPIEKATSNVPEPNAIQFQFNACGHFNSLMYKTPIFNEGFRYEI